jgi:hypothetical protein
MHTDRVLSKNYFFLFVGDFQIADSYRSANYFTITILFHIFYVHEEVRICKIKKLYRVKGKVVPVLNEFKHYAMKAYGGLDA